MTAPAQPTYAELVEQCQNLSIALGDAEAEAGELRAYLQKMVWLHDAHVCRANDLSCPTTDIARAALARGGAEPKR